MENRLSTSELLKGWEPMHPRARSLPTIQTIPVVESINVLCLCPLERNTANGKLLKNGKIRDSRYRLSGTGSKSGVCGGTL
jgi:hypothetical protein